MSEYQINPAIPDHIFRKYDIRGIVEEDFRANNLFTIGLAVGTIALRGRVTTLVVGRDGRVSGPELSKALILGIIAAGCKVIDIGLVTTPMLYYAVENSEFRSGLMVSGSHNPPNYNGLKIMMFGRTWYDSDIVSIKDLIKSAKLAVPSNFSPAAYDNAAWRQVSDISANYLEFITRTVPLARKLKIVVDCGNGAGGAFVPKLFKMMGCEVTELYCEVDGHFPNHQPDPSQPSNMADIIPKVQELNADVGLAFDGDADRVGIVTNKGELIAADRLLLLLALDLLKRKPKALVVFDVKCGRYLASEIAKAGGTPIMSPTGHSIIKATMRRMQADLGGELSGHIFMKERWFNFDDGIYVAARFLELLAAQDKTSSELFQAIPQDVATPELKIPVPEANKFQIMQQILQAADFKQGKITTIDGLRVDFDFGFGLIRPSNTSPYLIACFAADTKEHLESIKAQFKTLLNKVDAAGKLGEAL